jgi:hypothetical protein
VFFDNSCKHFQILNNSSLDKFISTLDLDRLLAHKDQIRDFAEERTFGAFKFDLISKYLLTKLLFSNNFRVLRPPSTNNLLDPSE